MFLRFRYTSCYSLLLVGSQKEGFGFPGSLPGSQFPNKLVVGPHIGARVRAVREPPLVDSGHGKR